MNRISSRDAFTYIELLITLAIIAVLFVPMMQLFSHSLHSTSISQELITATNLARGEMERIKNLSATKAQLKRQGDFVYPVKINDTEWRIKREVLQDSDPLEVRVHVFREAQMDKHVLTLVTLIEDMIWEEAIPFK